MTIRMLATSTPTDPSYGKPAPETAQCPEELVPPTITEIQPAGPTSGSQITVIGSGGYVHDACGGYNESARTFQLYVDNEPVGELQCYVHRCEGKIQLASAITPGSHCLSTQKDQCEFEFAVAAP